MSFIFKLANKNSSGLQVLVPDVGNTISTLPASHMAFLQIRRSLLWLRALLTLDLHFLGGGKHWPIA